MAEQSDCTKIDAKTTELKDDIPDCPVCLQPCSYPVKLKCGHIFCFLCIKGVVFRSKRCALCRQDVDLEYFKNPVIVRPTSTSSGDSEAVTDHVERYQWYYEGRNGWWQYDAVSSGELEKAHKDNKRSCEILIAGFLYFVDFDNMVQFRKSEPNRRRRIKRDLMDAEKKGVAGLRLQQPENTRQELPQTTIQATMVTDSDTATSNCDVTMTHSNTVDDLPMDRLVVGLSSEEDDQNTTV